ncbi:MAG: ATP:cob(I)alamin adenosyltransferase [Verrucomicrobiota bacterium]
MSIATKRGDGGETDLLYGKRVPKTDLRVRANSKIDEFNARLGVARALLKLSSPETAQWIERTQHQLFALMGEIAVHPDDFDRHASSNMPQLQPSFLDEIENRLQQRESLLGPMTEWSVPGENQVSAAIHVARTTGREAELAVIELKETSLLNPTKGPLIIKILNRLSDMLWIEAKLAEKSSEIQQG